MNSEQYINSNEMNLFTYSFDFSVVVQSILSKFTTLTWEFVATERSSSVKHIITVHPTCTNSDQQYALHEFTLTWPVLYWFIQLSSKVEVCTGMGTVGIPRVWVWILWKYCEDGPDNCGMMGSIMTGTPQKWSANMAVKNFGWPDVLSWLEISELFAIWLITESHKHWTIYIM